MYFSHFIPLVSVLISHLHSFIPFIPFIPSLPRPWRHHSLGLCFIVYSPSYSQHSFLSSGIVLPVLFVLPSFSMSNAVPCVADGNAQLMGGLDSALEMDLAMPDDTTQSFLSPKAANTLGSTGSGGSQDRKGSDSLFDALEPRPVVPFSKRPPKAIEDIYNSLPSVESFFPDWPFHPLELPPSIPEKLRWRDTEKLKTQQDWNRELSLTRVHAPGTAAHRLLNHSFIQDVKDFSAEYESFRGSGFQTLSDGQKMANERPMPYIFGVSRYNPQLHNPEFYTSNQRLVVNSADEIADFHNKAFECSLCKFSPHHDDIPNWLYYTKVDENRPRYFYCLGCKGRDGDAQVKSFANLMAMVKEIVAISHAEEGARKMGMDGAITSVPLARFKRYEIMFSIEIEAAMVRRAIKAAKTQLVNNAEEFWQRQLERISGDFSISVAGKAVAKEIVGRYFTTETPRLFDTTGPLGQLERLHSTTPPGFPMRMESIDQHARILAAFDEGEVHFPVERSHTPPGWPKGYIPPVIADNLHQGDDSQASLGHPPTPVWFAERQTTLTTSPPPARSTTPPGYPRWFAFSPERVFIESDQFTDATTLTNPSTARSSIIQPEVHVPFRDFSAFIHPEGAFPGDHIPLEYPEGVITWLTRPDTPPGSPEDNKPPSSARSSRTLYEDFPQLDGAGDTPDSSPRSSIILPEDFGQQLADTVVECSSRRLSEIFRNRPLVDDKQESKEGSLSDLGHPLHRSPAVENRSCLLSQGGIPARLPPKTERIPPVKAKLPTKTERLPHVKSEGASLYNCKPQEENKKNSLSPGQPPHPSPTGDNSLYLRSHGGIPAKLPPKTERIPPTRSERASYYRHKPEASSPQKAEGTSFYSTDAQPAVQISRASFSDNSTTIEAQPPPQLDRSTFYTYNSNATILPKIERKSFYKCNNNNIESIGHSSSYESLSSIAEEKLEDHPESDFSDISAEWDSDESFDELPRRLKCLDLLDELIPPRRDEYMGCYTRMWNSRPMGKRGRSVDLSLNSILEDTELEGDELVQREEMNGKRVDIGRA